MYNRVYGKEGALVTKPQIVGWGWVVGLRVVIHSLGIYWCAIQNDD